METAAYRVMEDIESYNKLGGMKPVTRVWNQLFIIDQILGRKNAAINAMIRLQAYKVTDNEILNFQVFMNRARLENAAGISHVPFDSLSVR